MPDLIIYPKIMSASRRENSGDEIRHHEINYDEQVLANLRKPETRSGPVLRWDRILAHRKNREPNYKQAKPRDLISYAQTLSPNELRHFYDSGEISETNFVDLLAALPIEIYESGKALDYLCISPEDFARMGYRESVESQRVRKLDDLLEEFLRFSLLHPEARLTDFGRLSEEESADLIRELSLNDFYHQHFRGKSPHKIKPSEWLDFFRAYKKTKREDQNSFSAKMAKARVPAKDLDPIVALGSLNRHDLERVLMSYDLLSPEEMRRMSPQKLVRLREGITRSFAKTMRNEFF